MNDNFENIIEAMLFSHGGGLHLDKIAISLNIGKNHAKREIDKLKEKYKKESRGIQVLVFNDVYQMATNSAYSSYIEKLTDKKQVNLTKAQLETLAIIAYKQPITKPLVEQIRGVDSTQPINKLLEYNIICEQGRLNEPGRPILFKTTDEFLRRFGISNLDQLPPMQDIRALIP